MPEIGGTTELRLTVPDRHAGGACICKGPRLVGSAHTNETTNTLDLRLSIRAQTLAAAHRDANNTARVQSSLYSVLLSSDIALGSCHTMFQSLPRARRGSAAVRENVLENVITP